MSDPAPGPPDSKPRPPIARRGAFPSSRGPPGFSSSQGSFPAGLLLYQRVYGDSWVALLVILAVFGGLGAYLAWLVGVLAFSAVRQAGTGSSVGGEGVRQRRDLGRG